MNKPKRITSFELTEIRTVLSRAKTALVTVDGYVNMRETGSDWHRDYFATPHTDHEISLMRSALMTSIDVLEKVEQSAGYKGE
jgi:hypothetical protein